MRSLRAQGQEVEAVRLVRRRTGLSLLLAVRAVRALDALPNEDESPDEGIDHVP